MTQYSETTAFDAAVTYASLRGLKNVGMVRDLWESTKRQIVAENVDSVSTPRRVVLNTLGSVVNDIDMLAREIG